MPRIVHFEIEAQDMQRAVTFYQEVFAWNVQKYEGMDYWMATTGARDQEGIDGGLMPVAEGKAPRTINCIDVPNLQEYLDKVTANGGKVVTETQLIPNVGYFAYCEDTEGVVFGMMEFLKPE